MAVSELFHPATKDYRLPVLIVLVLISLLLEVIIHWYLGIEVVYSHFFYIPVILAAIWYGLRGLVVAVLLGVILVTGTYVTSGVVDAGSVLRALMFLIVALVIAIVLELIRREQGRMISGTKATAPGPGVQVRESIFVSFGNRMTTVSRVRRLKERGDVAGLIRALRSRDHQVQYEAVEALGELKNPAAVPALMGALTGDQYSGIRWKAAEALVKIGEPSVEPLISVTDNPDADIRWKAAVSLGEIGDSRAIGPLVAMLGDDDRFVRSRAQYALALMGTPAIPALSDTLGHENPDIRQGSVAVLGRIGGREAIGVLMRALGDPSADIRQDAASALAKQGKDAFGALSDALKDKNPLVRQGAALALAGIGDNRALPVLMHALFSSDPETENVLLNAIHDIETKEYP